MIRIYLDSVRKYRNTNEYRNVNRASCVIDGNSFERVGDGNIESLLSRDIIDAGHSPEDLVEIWRGERRVFAPVSLRVWAENKFGKGEQPKQLRRAEQ